MILITGALGYIGSHLCVELALSTEEDLLLVDSSAHESEHTLDLIEHLSHKPCQFIKLDLRCEKELEQLFQSYPKIHTVVHCAAKKSVSDSIKYPLEYYEHNLIASFNLLKAMKKAKVHNLVFSSSAAVYADAGDLAYDETMPSAFHTPYGNTKLMFEVLLKDYCAAEKSCSAMSLRYFNVAGAHPSGLLGELLSKSSGALFPEILKVASGHSEYLCIYGNDYLTPDGTAIRDYIHIMDVVRGHLDAIQYLKQKRGFQVVNLGCGQGYSVLQVLKAFEKISGLTIPYEFKPRRPGDLCTVVANADKAKLMGWTAQYGIEKMIEDAWHYTQSSDPNFQKTNMCPR